MLNAQHTKHEGDQLLAEGKYAQAIKTYRLL